MIKKLLAGLIGAIMIVGYAVPAGCLVGYINSQTAMIYDGVVSGDEVELRLMFDGSEKEYHIIINSPGGGAFQAISMINHIEGLQEAGAKVTTEVSGMAFSAGANIWLSGDVRIIHKSDLLMFHSVQLYDPRTHEKVAEDQLTDNDKKIRTTLNVKLIKMMIPIIGEKAAHKLVDNEVFMTGQEAYDMGLATILK